MKKASSVAKLAPAATAPKPAAQTEETSTAVATETKPPAKPKAAKPKRAAKKKSASKAKPAAQTKSASRSAPTDETPDELLDRGEKSERLAKREAALADE